MKLVIKVGEATIEVEGEKLKATKIVGGSTPVEITESQTNDEKLQGLLDRAAAGLGEVLIRERQAGNL